MMAERRTGICTEVLIALGITQLLLRLLKRWHDFRELLNIS